MDIRKYKEFAVVGFTATQVKGCRFRNRKTHFELASHASCPLDKVDPASGWKEVFRLLSIGGDCPLFLCGTLEGGFFFRTRMLPLAPKAMRDALELDLSQHLLGEMEETHFQFASFSEEDPKGNDDGEVGVNVYAVPGKSLEKLAAMLTQCGRKADEFFFPLLALNSKDAPLYLPEVEEKYFFADGAWQMYNPASWSTDVEMWKKSFSNSFKMPEDFPLQDFMPLLLTARLILSPGFAPGEEAFRLLPDTLRAKRLRTHLKVAALLLVLILINGCWSFSGDWLRDLRAYRALAAEKSRLTEENRSLRSRLRKEEKDVKERQRLVNLRAGEHDVVGKIADITNLLPHNILVSNLRWSDSGVDMLMFSEAEEVSVSELVRRGLKYWKISNIQQRNFGGASTMINLRLVNVTPEDKK